MSGAQVSSFPSQNILYDMATGATGLSLQHSQNQLLQQQQDITEHDIAMTGQAAAPLLGMSEEDAAAAYPGVIQQLKAMGGAKYAPPTYPGHAATQALVQRAMPLLDQFKMGYITPPGTQAAIDAALRPGTTGTTGGGQGTAGGTGGAAAPATSGAPATTGTPSGGATIGQRQNNPGNLTFAGQPGASPGQGNRFASFPDMPTGVAANADQLALYQTQHGINTVRGAVTRWVGDPKADLGSYIGDISKALGVGPDDKIDLTNPDVQAKFIQAQFPHESAGGGYVLNPADVQKGVQMAAANRGRAVQAPGTQIAIAPPQGAPGGVAARTGGTDVAGPGAGPGGAPGADLVGPRVLPPIGPGSPVVTPQSLANTPAPQPQAQVPQPPANRVMPGSADGPPAPTPPPAAQPSAPATRANLPRAADIPTGVNSQQYRDAADLQRRALILEAQVDPTGRLKQLAAGLRQQAQLLLQTDSVVQTQEGQLHPLTGQIGDPTKPLPHYVYDPTQHAYIDTTGTNKPEFEPAQRDSAVAQRDVMELGPKVANGTATPQEQARYATAVETYRQPVLRDNPVTKETVRVNTRELPAGFPEPTGLRGTGASGGAGASGGSNVVIPGYSPQQQEIERDPAKAKVADMQYERNSKEIGAINDSVREAQANNIRVQEMRNIMDNISTGPGTGSRAKIAAYLQRWAPAALTGWSRDYGNLDGAAAVEAFTKLGLTSAGQQERSVLGNRGGYRAIEMFKAANPNVDLLNPANSSILATQLISSQANIDYAQAASKHFAEQEQRYGDTHKYTSLEQFDQQWNAQRNPQVYAAAMGAISGQPPEQWSKGLSDAEYNRALDIISRADPSATVNTKEGRKVMQPKAASASPLPPGFAVVR